MCEDGEWKEGNSTDSFGVVCVCVYVCLFFIEDCTLISHSLPSEQIKGKVAKPYGLPGTEGKSIGNHISWMLFLFSVFECFRVVICDAVKKL